MKWALIFCIVLVMFGSTFSNVIGGNIGGPNDTERSSDLPTIETSSYIRLELPHAKMHASILRSDGFDVLNESVTKKSLELI